MRILINYVATITIQISCYLEWLNRNRQPTNHPGYNYEITSVPHCENNIADTRDQIFHSQTPNSLL